MPSLRNNLTLVLVALISVAQSECRSDEATHFRIVSAATGSVRPVKDVRLLMQAEDLHIAPVITWWNNRNLWLDQEIPDKTLTYFEGRFLDVMAGEDEREGGALLFFHLKRPLQITGSTREYPSPMKFVAEARKTDGVWIDIEKPFWWDAPLWIASGQVDSIGIANNHMCRSRHQP